MGIDYRAELIIPFTREMAVSFYTVELETYSEPMIKCLCGSKKYDELLPRHVFCPVCGIRNADWSGIFNRNRFIGKMTGNRYDHKSKPYDIAETELKSIGFNLNNEEDEGYYIDLTEGLPEVDRGRVHDTVISLTQILEKINLLKEHGMDVDKLLVHICIC